MEDPQPQYSQKFLFIGVCIVNLLCLQVGMMLSWTSPVLITLKEDSDDNPLSEPISDSQSSWIGSLVALGAGVGPFIAFATLDTLGRKITLIILALPLVTAFFMLAFTSNVNVIFAARVLAGLSVGGVFMSLPMYVAEVAEDRNRGMAGSSMNNFITAGSFSSYVLGAYVPIMPFSLICAAVGCLFLVLFVIFLPETPIFLIAKKKHAHAEQALMKLRSCSNVKQELATLTRTVETQTSNSSLGDLFTIRSNRKALIIAVSLGIFQQLSGINVIQFYATDIFEKTGSSISEDVSSIIIGVTQFVASFVTPLAVDRQGRKILLLISAAGMMISEIPLGLYFVLKDNGTDVDSIFWLPIVCLILYIITYNFGFGPLPWTIMAELFPANVKAFGSALTASSCWLVSFVLTKYFNDVSDSIGMGGSFWIFSGGNALGILFVIFFVFETKGKSNEEIQKILAQ